MAVPCSMSDGPCIRVSIGSPSTVRRLLASRWINLGTALPETLIRGTSMQTIHSKTLLSVSGVGHSATALRKRRSCGSFHRNARAGIFLGNFNALDLWVWYSQFDDCAYGITNWLPNLTGAGNWRVYGSIFRRSTQADNGINHTGVYSMRNNYSIGSRRFIEASGTNNPSPTVIQGNTIVDTSDPQSISIRNQGPILLYDNVVRSLRSIAPRPSVFIGAFSNSDSIAVGNTFSVPAAIAVHGRATEIDTSVVRPGTIGSIEPPVPPTEPNLQRTVIEVPVGASTAVIRASNQCRSEPKWYETDRPPAGR